jgi:CRP-like cAMP-binding protein
MSTHGSPAGVQAAQHDARGGGRVGSDLPVELHVAELPGPLAARSRDIGVGGICVATPSAFALKSVKRVVIGLPSGPLSLEAEGCWQFDASGDDMVLSGLAFPSLSPEAIETLSNLVLESGRTLARFLYAQSDLRSFGLEEVLGLAQITRFRDVNAGHFVYRQDTAEPGDDSIFLVSRGAITLQARARGAREIPLAHLQVGELFGGMPLVGDAPHAESALAECDSRLLEIDRVAYQYLASARPWLAQRLAFTVARTYTRRLHDILARIRDRL